MRLLAGGLACALWSLAAAARAQVPAPTGDIQDGFTVDPRSNPSWKVGGTWGWDGVGGALVSSSASSATAQWASGSHYTGSLSLRLKLVSGRAGAAPKARLIFARDPATGAYRYVQITAGAPGSIILAQAGTIRGVAAKTFTIARKNVAPNVWLRLGVIADGYGKVSVTLASKIIFTAAVKLAPGTVGFSAPASKVAFDTFGFVADPDGEPCGECHAGQAAQPLAPNVYTYWDGTWWDKNNAGSATVQQGGHGDPGGLYAMGCTGGSGCHAMRLPAVGDHRNGVRESAAQGSTNPFHLRSGFIAAGPASAQDAQLTFDNYCATACHAGYGVMNMRHMGVSAGRPYLQLGLSATDPSGAAVPADMPLAGDLTSLAPARPLMATCVTCHDPHGTGVADVTGSSNHMVRRPYLKSSALCLTCHV